MRKAILGVVLGSIIYFVAGALSWMVLPWNNHGLKKLPEETLIRDTMKVVVKESGAYIFPNATTENGRMDEKTFGDLFRSGPTGLVFFRPAGAEPMNPKNFIFAALTAFGTSAFVMTILILLRKRVVTFGGRWVLVVLLGVFAWFNSMTPLWNWMFMPSSFALTVLLDVLFGFGLLGIVLAKFVPSETAR